MKKLHYILFLTIFAVLISFGASASPSSSPSSGNVSSVITQLSIDQTKSGKIGADKWLVGDWTASSPTLAKFTSDGKLGIMMNSTDNPTEALDVNGKIRLESLNSPSRPICADKDGTLVNCGFAEFYYGQSCWYSSGTYTCGSKTTTASDTSMEFKVPTGVSSITVEVYGSGASGYAQCGSSGGGNCSEDGGPTIFYDTNGTTALLTANGGSKPSGAHSGGAGGTASVASSSKITSSNNVTKTGGSGGSGDNGGSKSNYTVTCNYSGTSYNYTTRVAGSGGDGGIGGKSGNGSPAPGGLGGHPGVPLKSLSNDEVCSGSYNDNNGHGFIGDTGVSGIYGAGGGGGGGRGGETDIEINDLCVDGSYCDDATQGFAGGGGGGYAKTKISVTAGDVYKIKLSRGGILQGLKTEIATCWLNYHFSGTCSTGSLSGDGSGGYAKISW